MEEYILVTGSGKEQIRTAVRNLANLYAAEKAAQGIEIRVLNDTTFVVTFSHVPELEIFEYFVNYLRYPEGVELRQDATGYVTLGSDTYHIPEVPGTRMMFFVSKEDTAYDTVMAVSEKGYAYLCDFGGGVSKLPESERNFVELPLNLEELELLDRISPDPHTAKGASKNSGASGCMLALLALASGLAVSLFWVILAVI